MKTAFFSTKTYDKCFFEMLNDDYKHEINYLESHLNQNSAIMASGCGAICAFVNDIVNRDVIKTLGENNVKLIAMRCAGFNNVDLAAAAEYNIKVLRVPAYSPYAVAEHAVTLMLALNRRIPKAYNRIREGNFALQGLLGFDMHGKTVGLIGSGKIGAVTAKILNGFGCNIIAYDLNKNPEIEKIGAVYVDIDTLFLKSDIISLHCPLTPSTHHIINHESISKMKHGVMLINTSRGGLVNTQDVIEGLKSGKISYLGLDVYEEEGELFFEDLSDNVIKDDVFSRLLTFPNVLITGHQGFFTENALKGIAMTTLQNISDFENGKINEANLVSAAKFKK